MTIILGLTPRGRVTALATALFGPWPNSSAFALPSGAEPGPGVCHHIVHNIREGGHPRHQVPVMGHSQTSKQICLYVAPGYGWAQVAVF